jgi:Polyketide cyclase / dehydrase and lipid transport
MFGRNDARRAAEDAVDTLGPYADRLAHDKKLRRGLGSAVGHGFAAGRRAKRQTGLAGAARRLAHDDELQEHLRRMTAEVEKAGRRLRKPRRHRLRTALFVLGGTVAAAMLVPVLRRRIAGNGGGDSTTWTIATIDEAIEVDAPVDVAYDMWTQFEQFPLFMEGVEDVREADDGTLHWVVSVAGRRGEWDARILERQAPSRITWESVDGKQTRGTVSFERLGDDRTRIDLSMRYRAEGAVEAVGSAAGIDSRRVRGDLERFKDLVESPDVADRRGVERGTTT